MPNGPLVSVCMLAYNHERFIEQAMQSVLTQNAAFDFELVVGEDCSTDATRSLAKKLADSHPDRIRLLERETNLGMYQNFVDTYSQCRGKYVAFLEGDDYWCDTQKLQRQVDAMEANPHWSFCFHQARQQTESGAETLSPRRANATEYSLAEIARVNPVTSATVMLRRTCLPRVPEWLSQLKMCDWPLWMLLAAQGAAGYLAEPMAVYRIHAGGYWSKTPYGLRLQAISEMYRRVLENVDPADAAEIRTASNRHESWRRSPAAWALDRLGIHALILRMQGTNVASQRTVLTPTNHIATI